MKPNGIKEDYFSFNGRINRKTFLIRNLVLFLTIIALTLLQIFLEDFKTPSLSLIFFHFLLFFCCIFILISKASLNIRRFHDLNKSGWFTLLGIIPIISFFVMIYLYLFKGTVGSNKFGEDIIL